MGWHRAIMGLRSYGVARARGKALALCLVLLATPAASREITVLAFGDSLTQGYGLVEDKGFVPTLARWLDARGVAARVINGGVSGETTAGGAARVEWSLTPEIDAMILNLGANDMLRGIDPGVTRANLAAILDAAAKRDVAVLLVRVPATGNYGAAYKAAFDAVYPNLADTYGTLYFGNFFAGLGAASFEQARAFMQPDGIHPNAEGVARIAAGIGPAVIGLIAVAK